MSVLEGILYMMWRGLAIGIFVSAPMGPVGILCIQRTLDKGRREGFYTGIGAAISDLLYCLITGFGLSFIEEFLERNQNVIQLAGSAVLIAFSIYLFKKNPARGLKTPTERRTSAHANILRGFLFTFSNPLILFLIIGLFARFNFLMPDIKFYHYMIGFIFIFAGAIGWWWIVTFFVDKVRAHFNVRSMWLINRIIGVIILIFAVVGTVTGIMSMTQSARADTHWNSVRGFYPFGNKTDNILILTNEGPDTLHRLTKTEGISPLTFSFRCVDLNNHPMRSYNYVGCDSRRCHTSSPGWAISMKSADNSRLIITFHCRETDFRGESKRVMTLHAEKSDSKSPPLAIASNQITSDIDLYSNQNAFRIRKEGRRFVLSGGNREYNPLLEFETDFGEIDSIGFAVMPGGAIQPSDIHLSVAPGSISSAYLSPESLEKIIRRSSDPATGYYAMLDRSMNETMLRPGGDYLLAMVDHQEGGYSLYYIEGAVANASQWKPGMLKARLKPTRFPDIFNLEWIDAEGRLLHHDIKCQREDNILNVTFPYHSSTMRLAKVSLQRGK